MKKGLFLSVLVVALLALSACAKKSYEIAYGGSICGSPVSIASLNGYYKDEGLDVELVSGASFETIRSYLAAGKMPVINGDFQFFPSVYEGVDVKLIAGLHEGCIKILVPYDSDIYSIADIRGKRVAVDEIGGTPMAVASVAAGAAGITDPKNDIVWLPFPGDQEIQAVATGKADVVAAWDPIATMAEQEVDENGTPKYRTLLDIANDPLFAGRNCCFLFASGKLLKENPKVIVGVLNALNRAVAFEAEHTQEAAELLVKEKKVATEDVDLVAKLLGSFNFGAHHSHSANLAAKDDAVYFAQKLTEIGYLPADLDVQKFVDDMYVDVSSLVK